VTITLRTTAFADKDYINLTTPFMEAMAVVAAQFALSDSSSIDMSALCHKANVAAQWINRQRVSTTEAQMQFFKTKRQILFKQWDSAFRGPARDDMGHFRSKREHCDDADTRRDSRPTTSKKSKLDAYGDIFAQYHCCV